MGLGQVGRGVALRVMGAVGVRVRVGNAGLPRGGLPGGGLRVAPGDEVPVLELRAAGLLRRQLELDEHHVIANAQGQGEGGAAGQEVTDLKGGADEKEHLRNTKKTSPGQQLCHINNKKKEQISHDLLAQRC